MRRSGVSVASVLVALFAAGAGCADSPKPPTGAATTGAAATRVATFEWPAAALRQRSASARPAMGRKLRVVTTVAPITSIVANVAGDRASVRGIIPEGRDSHTF